jgi:Rod binding domain-containing protein
MAEIPLAPALNTINPQAPQGAGAKPADDKLAVAKKSAQDFEALFLSQMMTHMFAGIDAKGMFGGGAGEEAWRDVLTQEYAKVMAKAGGIGVADSVMREMIRQQEAK